MMSADVEDWINQCDRCIKRKTHATARAPLVSIVTSQPMELLCIDYLTLEISKGGYQHILVITDHFTKYAMAVPTKNQSAKVTAEALFNGFLVHTAFHGNYSAIKVQTLRVSSSRNFARYQE